MATKTYFSNLAPSWPIAAQEKLLRRRLPDLNMKAAHCDELRARQLRSRNPEWLGDRAALVRPTSRANGSMILHVATLAILAWRVDDFRRWAQQLADRGCIIEAHAEAMTFDLANGGLEAAVAQFPISRTASGRLRGALSGAAASAATRNARSKAAADKIKDRWGDPAHTALALCEEAGFTYHTMRRWLPRWEIAQARRERNAKRKAGKHVQG